MCQPTWSRPRSRPSSDHRPTPPARARDPSHLRIAREHAATGESRASFRARWSAFTRPDDVVCAWGRFPLDVLAAEGVTLPAARLDLRPALGSYLGTRPCAIEDCMARLDLEAPPPFALGRGGVRLAALAAVDKLMSA